MNIRPVQTTDAAEWLRMRAALWPEFELEQLAQDIEKFWARTEGAEPEVVFVAEHPGGGLCGMLEVTIHKTAPGCKTDRIGYLEGWYVDPDCRAQGVGRALVEAAEAWARTQGCREMASDTTPDYPISPAAHARLGYHETERYFRKDLF